MKTLWISLIASVAFSGHGQAAPEKTQLLLFAAPWCLICKSRLPKLAVRLKDEIGSTASLEGTLYVETGATPFQPPTQATADDFVKKEGLPFPAKPDPWKWQTYHKYYNSFFLPGVVVLDEAGKPVKIFPAGSFDEDDLVDLLKTRLGK